MKVFYRPEMVAKTNSLSPSSYKPKLVVEDWLADPLIDVEICDFPPATKAQICLAHDPDFVGGFSIVKSKMGLVTWTKQSQILYRTPVGHCWPLLRVLSSTKK